MYDENDPPEGTTGLDRRTLLKRSAVVGGTALWATPVVQSLARPAFAAGSPVCVDLYRFKYDVEEGTFDNGVPSDGSTAAECLPDNYAAAEPLPPNGQIPGHSNGVTFQFSDAGKSAQIILPPGCVLLDGDAKAGAKDKLECEDATFAGVQNGKNVYDVSLDTKEISFIAGVICCS